jgi:lantibiotic biosynthesis protein
LWRVQVDTYEREVERYGGYEGVQIAEEIFHADSRAVAELLAALCDEDAKTNLRICLGVLGVNSLLEDFDLGLKARLEIARQLRDGFRGEMAGDALRMRVLGEKISNGFRTDREQLLTLVGGGESKYLKPLRRRSAEIQPYVVELREKEDDLSQPLHELLKSYVHMHVNRLLRFPDRQQELVIYDYLYRTLDFFRAREVREARGVSLPEQVL